jgi:putative heme-binding domain-containing protein
MTTSPFPLVRTLLLLSSCISVSVPARVNAQDWIWSGKNSAENEVCFFRRAFQISDAPEKAVLSLACDNKATIYLDGKAVGGNDNWNEPTLLDLTTLLKPGNHVLAVRAENEGGPGGLLAKLDLSFPRARKQTVVSDTSWLMSSKEINGWNKPEFATGAFASAVSLGKYGIQPWGAVLASVGAAKAPSAARYPKEATPAESLKVADGFKVELLRSSQPGEGSWVAMTVDPKGRLIVSPQDKEPMLRFTIGKDGQITKMETIELPVRGAMGLLCAFDSLYVNGAGPDGYHLYRLRDTNGDDLYDKVELIRRWKGGPGEHGAHGIVLGKDKKLYVVNGNFVDVPDDILPTSPHRNYRDDLVLPRMEDGNGFGAGRKPPGGYVVRLDPDGENAELFASGQRNTYDIAFNQDGELFGFDSDMEWDWGSPWYRPTRVYHIVSGGDQGFREGSAKWPEYYPDSLPAAVNIGIGSPTGVGFGTGAKFPRKYQNACFVMDWSYGRILAVHLTPDGSSYGGTFENFVVGKPLNVTDLQIGKDGAMYFTIGGRKTQGGLYRVTYTGQDSTRLAKESGADRKSKQARALRQKLESFHGRQDSKALAFAWPHLDSEDRSIRYAARIAVEAQPIEQWRQQALDETRKRASLTALLALARFGSADVQTKLLESLGRYWPNDLSDDQKLEALRVCEVSFSRMGQPSEDVARDVVQDLAKVFPGKNWPLNRELSQLLIALNAPGIVKQVLDLRDSAATQEEQLHYMVILRNVKAGWTLDERQRYFAWFQNRPKTENAGPTSPGGSIHAVSRSTKHPEETVQWFKAVDREYGDGASLNNFFKNLHKATTNSLTLAEQVELAGWISTTPVAASAKPKKEYQFVREWKMLDFAADLERTGKGRNFERGREAYAATQCLQCHRFGNEGGAVGPDITAVASRFSRADLLSSIIEPSKVVSEQYQNITVVKKDGDDVTGRLVEETDTKLVVVPNQLTGDKVEVKKSDVASRAPSKLSSMPEGLVNILTKNEVLDLLAYIESGGKKEHAAFRP